MTKYKTHCYLIHALTNLHVGSGDTDYGPIDKQVQRDPASGHPTIHSSGLKGALREYFEEGVEYKNISNAENSGESETNDNTENKSKYKFITHIFGSSPKETDNEKVKKGKYRFLNADILALPRPKTEGGFPYDLVTSQSVLKDISSKVTILGLDIKLENFLKGKTDPSYVKETDAFAELSQELPVVARNHLENGISQNLWYEEIVPRESYFICFIQAPDGDIHFNFFNQHVDNKVIQIGANASVGYGLCQFTQLA